LSVGGGGGNVFLDLAVLEVEVEAAGFMSVPARCLVTLAGVDAAWERKELRPMDRSRSKIANGTRGEKGDGLDETREAKITEPIEFGVPPHCNLIYYPSGKDLSDVYTGNENVNE
jgi:hypothetical protein